MPAKSSHAPGSFCFPEAASGDLEAAKKFYGQLLGWDVRDVTGGFYSIAERKGKPVAGMYGIMPDQREKGVRPHWLSYVSVASADASAEKATELGGKVLAAPFDIPAVGRMAVVQDPTGACFGLWEPRGHEGAGLVDEPGAPCWYELLTWDAPRAVAFYTGLFGWKPRVEPSPNTPPGEYTVFHNGPEHGCGMLAMSKERFGDAPSHWEPYFAVEDCDAVAKECVRLGGKVCRPPSDIPRVGRFAVLEAPDGACFTVIRDAGK